MTLTFQSFDQTFKTSASICLSILAVFSHFKLFCFQSWQTPVEGWEKVGPSPENPTDRLARAQNKAETCLIPTSDLCDKSLHTFKESLVF